MAARVAFVLIGLALVALAPLAVYARDVPPVAWRQAIIVAQGALYLAAAVMIERRLVGGPRVLAFGLLAALGMRLVILFLPPDSTDLYRYIWDGRVQAAGVNPYLYVPADPALAALRDAAIYPRINRADYAHTIYPPMAELAFFLITRVSESVTAMKAAMVGCEIVTGLVLWRLLARTGAPGLRVLLFAWHPLPVMQFSGDGHVDALGIAWLWLGFLAAARGARGLAGMALAGAALTKYIPVVVAPALYRRLDQRLPLAFAVTLLVLYAPYLSAGRAVFGFLAGYIEEEKIEAGSGLYLLALARTAAPLPGGGLALYALLAVLALGALAARLVFARRFAAPDIRVGLILAASFTLLFSPHFPWYFAWLTPFLVLQRSYAVVYLTLAAPMLIGADWPPSIVFNTGLYAPFLAIAAAEGLALRPRRASPPLL